VPCEETRDDEPPAESPGFVLWNATGNRVVGNVVSDSRLADLGTATLDALSDVPTSELDNCFSDNTFTTSAPRAIETLAPCEGEGSGDFTAGAVDLAKLLATLPPAPPEDTFRETPVPGDQPNMPDPESTPAKRYDGPTAPDVDAIEVPAEPDGG
jgi:hypothetical protein